MSNLQIEEKLFNIENSLSKLSLAVKTILSTEEAADFLGFKPSYFYKLTSNKKIRFFKSLGKLIYFKKEDLEAFLLRNPSEIYLKEDLTPENHWKKNKKHSLQLCFFVSFNSNLLCMQIYAQ